MVPLSAVVCLALLAVTIATEVDQCPGKSLGDLSNTVQLSPCKKPPCRLKKGTNQHITMRFTPGADIPDLKNHVTAEVFGVPLPFIGVDGYSVSDKVTTETGEKASWPLKAGTTYIYKDMFPILKAYPSINVRVHWSLETGENNEDIVCFEVPARIV